MFAGALLHAGRLVLDAVLPPRCLACGLAVDRRVHCAPTAGAA